MDGERDILDQSGGRRRSKILARLFWFHFLTSRFRNIPLRRCWWWAFVCRIPRDSSLSPASSSRARAGCLLPYILRIRVWTRGVPLGVIFIIHRAIWTGWTCGLSAYIPGRPTYNMYKSGAPHHFSFCFFHQQSTKSAHTHKNKFIFLPFVFVKFSSRSALDSCRRVNRRPGAKDNTYYYIPYSRSEYNSRPCPVWNGDISSKSIRQLLLASVSTAQEEDKSRDESVVWSAV